MAVSLCLFRLSEGDELALFGTRSALGGLAAGERQGRKNVPVQVVIDVEVAGEPGAGVLGLVPRAVPLTFEQERPAPRAYGVVTETRELQGEHRPRGLRWCARPDTREGLVDIRVAGFTPAAVGVLHPADPCGGVAHHVGAGAQRDQRTDHAP